MKTKVRLSDGRVVPPLVTQPAVFGPVFQSGKGSREIFADEPSAFPIIIEQRMLEPAFLALMCQQIEDERGIDAGAAEVFTGVDPQRRVGAQVCEKVVSRFCGRAAR